MLKETCQVLLKSNAPIQLLTLTLLLRKLVENLTIFIATLTIMTCVLLSSSRNDGYNQSFILPFCCVDPDVNGNSYHHL